jgi:hypothetical protein
MPMPAPRPPAPTPAPCPRQDPRVMHASTATPATPATPAPSRTPARYQAPPPAAKPAPPAAKPAPPAAKPAPPACDACPCRLAGQFRRRRPDPRPRERTSVTLASLVPKHKAWMPRSCSWNDMAGTSTPYPRSRTGAQADDHQSRKRSKNARAPGVTTRTGQPRPMVNCERTTPARRQPRARNPAHSPHRHATPAHGQHRTHNARPLHTARIHQKSR